jgi:DNA-binding transcriptional ArsR family regulator
MTDDRTRIDLKDALAMRAYAHPLRLKLVGLLRREGPQTATQAAKALGDNVPNCSFHLRQLAKYGLVERAEGSDNRERPWRASAMSTGWDDAAPLPELRAAADHLTASILTTYFEMARTWLQHREDETIEWRRVTGISDQTLYVTPAEMAGIRQRLDEALEPFLDRQTDPSSRPEGSRPINLIQLAMPWEGNHDADS